MLTEPVLLRVELDGLEVSNFLANERVMSALASPKRPLLFGSLVVVDVVEGLLLFVSREKTDSVFLGGETLIMAMDRGCTVSSFKGLEDLERDGDCCWALRRANGSSSAAATSDFSGERNRLARRVRQLSDASVATLGFSSTGGGGESSSVLRDEEKGLLVRALTAVAPLADMTAASASFAPIFISLQRASRRSLSSGSRSSLIRLVTSTVLTSPSFLTSIPTMTSPADLLPREDEWSASLGSSTPSGDFRGSKHSSSAPSGALRSLRVLRTEENRSKRPSPNSSSSAFPVLPPTPDVDDDRISSAAPEEGVVPDDPVVPNGLDPYALRMTGGVSMFSESTS